MSIKKLDQNDALDILKSINGKSSMDDGALSLWYNKMKSRNLAEIDRNLNDSVNSRISSIQKFIDICFQLATFDARVKYELATFLHSIEMMRYTAKEKFLDLARKEIENKMLSMELGLTSLDYKLKRAILLKANSRDGHDDDDEGEEIIEDYDY